LSDFSIQNEDTLQARPGIEIRGGTGVIKFTSFSSVISGNAQSGKPSESPKQTFVIGVNLVGKCENQTCRIYNVKQYFKMGLGHFNVSKLVWGQKCVACSTKFTNDQVTNILFSRCNFKIEGRADGEMVENSGTTGAGKYITFREENDQELSSWNFLEVMASEL